VDGPGEPPAVGQPTGPSPEQAAAAAAARQAVAYRLLGAACALVGVLLLVGGLLALRGKPATRPPAAGATATASSGTSATTAPATTATTATPPTTAAPATTPAGTRPPAPTRTAATPARAVVRAPLTVLNNTTRAHLADQAAARFRAGGWQVVKIGNFTGQIPATTVYFTPGSGTEEQAAYALAAQFSGIARVLPRYAGLPSSVYGVIVVLAPDWS